MQSALDHENEMDSCMALGSNTQTVNTHDVFSPASSDGLMSPSLSNSTPPQSDSVSVLSKEIGPETPQRKHPRSVISIYHLLSIENSQQIGSQKDATHAPGHQRRSIHFGIYVIQKASNAPRHDGPVHQTHIW